MSTKRYKAEEVSEDSSAGSGSDFDDDEDPDKIEVPGGGKDLATAAGIGGVKEEKPSIPAPLIKGQGGVSTFVEPLPLLNQKFSNKIPGGLVTKSNAAPGYEMVRVGGSQGTPGFMGAGGMGPVGQMPASNPYGFPPSLASLAGFNPAAFFQQSKSTSAMEMSNMMGMGSLMSLGSMTGLSPFMLQQFLNQNGMHQNWSGGLSGITSIALTTDGWTSIAVESYVSLTLNYITKNFEARHFMLEIKPFGESHTSQHLFEFAAQAIEEWGLQRDATTTIYFVTDNAPNIVRALSMNEDWIRIPCFAHTLQLCVKDAIEACKGFVELCRKCRGIVGFFGRSSTARQSLLMMQKVSDPNSIPLDLIQDVDTRWNFQYDMLERFVHLRRALGAVLSEPKMPDNLTGTEWNMIATYVRLLAPLKDATILMSGEDYPTLSTYIPITDGLIKATQTFINSGSEGNLLGRNLLTSLNARFDGRYDNVTLLMAMLTDPRYKNRLLPDEKKPAAIEILRQQILSLKNRMKAPDRPLQRGEPLQPVISKTAGKAVSQLWMNSGDPGKMSMQPTLPEEEEVDDEDMGVAETYADYMPTKLKLGRKHPDPVVETASLSSVEPTDVWYKVVIPEEIIRSGALSALQLESITYASQQHEHLLPDGTRAGFLVGDGAGVGKGRTIAGIIFENYLRGRKRAIWVSVSNDLKYDAERDLKDIGAGKIEVHPLNKFKYAKISSAVNGNVKKGVIFSTYSALIGESSQSGGKYKSRLKQLLQWCGEDFDGLIVFDECHRAKNLCPTGSSKPTKTGLTVLELQNKLPKARVVYASATGASEPRNMAYMVRCGMWGEGTPFPEFTDFIAAVEKRGVGAMEIVAMDMKLRGMYIARQLSFHGVAFKIEEVPLSKEFTKVYDTSVRLWVEAMQKFQEAAELIDAENRMKKTMWGQFWSSHQRFFKYLCIAAKVKHAVAVAREAVKCGKCVVIGLQSTGEARTLEQLERDDGELSDFVSTAKGVLQTLVEKHFPAPDRNRIHRLLGLEPPKTGKSHNGDLEEAGGSAGKRKPVRQAAQRASKKVKTWSTDDDVSEDDRNGGGRSSGSEFKLSGTESEEENRSDDESNASSDFNPFYSDSDSDADPWDRRKKKGKKHKKSPKKRLSTQDKIQSMLASKTSHNKSKRNGDSSMGMPGMGSTLSQAPPRDAIERACSIKEELLAQIESLGEKLPPNTLDQLIDELGGPENVAEMTGRKGRVVQTEDGAIQYESRSEVDVPLETLNLTEKQRFMDGEKTVAIISEAASSGISLQSDRRARNQMRRVHITLELPWSADRAIQQFGRTHRSNQVNAPEYIFLISDLAGERRFASIVAKRLESLGALTHGDRRATETRDLSQFNIDNKYGRAALEATMKTIMGYDSPLVPPPQDYKGDFFKDVADALVGVGLICNSENMPGVLTLDKDYNNMSKFLNRILGMPVDLQNRLFKYFTDTLNAIVTQAKKTGRFDMGILDLGTSGENVKRVKLYRFLRKHATGIAPTELHIVHVERGMSWSEAMDRWASLTGSKEGFYLSHQVRNGKQTAILAIAVEGGKKKVENKKDQLYTVYRPNTGLQLRQESLGELEKKYKKVPTEEAEPHWIQQYDSSVDTCSHAYWRGNCKNTTLGLDCEVGLRRRSYNVLAGSVLSVWSRVENVLAARSGHNSKMQVVRLRTDESLKIVGTLIPKTCMESLREALSSDAEKTEEQTF